MLKAFVVLILCCLLAEQSARLFIFGLDSFSYFKINSFHSLEDSGLVKASTHPGVIYELKPNLNTYFKMARLRTNPQGLRDREYSLAKPSNTLRVAVVGDSYTMPSGVELEDAFHKLLETRLNAESTGKKYEFINFGVGGYDPGQSLATLKHRALGFKPDLILFCLSEPFETVNSVKYQTHPYKVKPATYPFFESFFIQLLRAKIIPKPGADQAAANLAKTERIKDAGEILSELGRIRKEISLPLFVVLVQNRHDNEQDVAALESMITKNDLCFIDASGAFKNRKRSEYSICKIDNHPNAKANLIFEESIYNYFKANDFLKQ